MEGADIDAELTADLIGDYLFTDSDFIRHLSANNRNVFQKIYDEIKYLCKIATAGSKEAKQLEQVKRAFERAYRESGEGTVKSDIKYSITEAFDDNNGNHYDNAVLLDTDFFDGIHPRNWGAKLRDEINKRSSANPLILPITDENGETTILEFAKPTDRVKKEGGANHKVNDELSSTSDNISKLAVVHIDEIVSVSEESNPYYTNENNHQWLDKNGWLHRNANVINSKNGNIYNLTVDIAKTADGRTVLYATNGKIKRVGNVDVNSLKIKGSRQNSNSNDIIPQNSEKSTGNEKLSLSQKNIAPIKHGNYNVYGKDIALGIAPIREDISQKKQADGIAPIKKSADTHQVKQKKEEPQKDHSDDDRLSKAYARIEQELEENKNLLTQELEARRASMESSLANKDTYIGNRALELYNELRNLKKGVKASEGLAYLLDSGFAWNELKSTLLKVNRWSSETVNPESEAESVIRKMLNEDYDRKKEELGELDNEYQEQLARLEKEAREKKEKTRRAAQKQSKMKENAEFAAELIGDTSAWRDKKTGLQYSTNTERRNLRDIVRDENGRPDIAKADAINDALNGQYNREEAEKNRELGRARKKYAELKITRAEDAYIQMLGELRHNPDTTLTQEDVAEYYEKHKNNIDARKVDKVIEMVRKDYDDWHTRLNELLREQGMKEIPYRKGYFPHFTDTKQNFIQKLFNWKTRDDRLPTSIAGLTEAFRPSRSWQSFNKQRYTDVTDYSFMKGFDTYSQGVLDWIYHIDTLQKRRAVENYIRYTHSDEGIKARIDAVYKSEELDAEEAQAQIEHILSEANNPLNNFVQDFTTHTNILAGKKNSLDRTAEQTFNRKIYSVMTNVQNRVSANMVLANIRSALTNFIPITQSWAQVSPARSIQAIKETVANAIKDDGLIERSTFLTNRLRTPDNLYNTAWDKILDKAGIMFEVVDSFSSQVIWRSKYNQNLERGMTEAEAIANADRFTENVMAGRSKGNEPTLFNAKNPLIKAFTMFQLEVNNQYGYLFKDVPKDLKAETEHWKLNLAKGYTTAFIGAYVYNLLLSQLTGSDAAFDPLGIIEELLKGLFDEEEEPKDTVTNLVENVARELPFVGGWLGGGRIPISSALPYNEEGYEAFVDDIAEGNWGAIGKEMMNPVLNVALPFGGGQLKKTVGGLGMFDKELPVSGSYTDSGKLRFPIKDTLGNRAQAALFGQWANENAREYFDKGYAPISEKELSRIAGADDAVSEYRKVRKESAQTKKESALKEERAAATNTVMSKVFTSAPKGYEQLKKEISWIESDTDTEGKTVNGSRKAKVIDYLNGLDADYGEKIILFKSAYKSDDTYNYDIVEYLNGRDDISYAEMETVLKELGFTVHSDGAVTW